MNLDKTEKSILITATVIFLGWFLLTPSQKRIEENQKYNQYFDNCVSSLNYKICSEIVYIKDEFDNENNFQQCVEKIGLEKCSLIRKRNEHPKHVVIVKEQQPGPLFKLLSDLPVLLITGFCIGSLLHYSTKQRKIMDRQIRKLERRLENDRIR